MATSHTVRRPDMVRLPDPDEPRHRGWRVAVGILVALVVFVPLVLFVSLAWLRMLPWSGPLVLEYSLPATYGKAADVGYTELRLTNPSRVDVTLDSVVAHEDPPVEVRDAWLVSTDARCERFAETPVYRTLPDRCRVPVEGHIVPAGTQLHDDVIVVVEVGARSEASWSAATFDLQFHAGPVAFSKPFGEGITSRAA